MSAKGRLYLAGKTEPLRATNWQITLGLCEVGRGVVMTAGQTLPQPGTAAVFWVARPNNWALLLTGLVEEARAPGPNQMAITLRETTAALDNPAAISLRNATPEEVLAEIGAQSGLSPVVNRAAMGKLNTTRLAAYHAPLGTLRAALDRLGRACGRSDVVWCAQPDGTLWWGPWAGHPLAAQALPELSRLASQPGEGRAITLPCLPNARPGLSATVDGQKVLVQRVTHTPDETRLEWGNVTADGLGGTGLRELGRTLIKWRPDLAGYHLPQLAEVVAHTEAPAAEMLAGRARPVYAVDVRLVPLGTDDPAGPVLHGVPLPVGPVWWLPPVGARVALAFLGGSPDYPVVSHVLPDGLPVPHLRPGEQVLGPPGGAEVRFEADGGLTLASSRTVRLDALRVEVEAGALAETVGQIDRAVDGDVVEAVGGSLRLRVLGLYKVGVGGDARISVAGGLDMATGGDLAATAGGSLGLAAGLEAKLASAGVMGVTIHAPAGPVDVTGALGVNLTSTAVVTLGTTASSISVSDLLIDIASGAKVGLSGGAGAADLLGVMSATLTQLQMETHTSTAPGSPTSPPLNLLLYLAEQAKVDAIKK